jgi:hypothetical protein
MGLSLRQVDLESLSQAALQLYPFDFSLNLVLRLRIAPVLYQSFLVAAPVRVVPGPRITFIATTRRSVQ